MSWEALTNRPRRWGDWVNLLVRPVAHLNFQIDMAPAGAYETWHSDDAPVSVILPTPPHQRELARLGNMVPVRWQGKERWVPMAQLEIVRWVEEKEPEVGEPGHE